ncbi:MAG: hemolysin III family protein [Gammaproteobacteria bacterium]|nr:hemolysin III family protein [Gammaproteobacteria bacterium]MDP2142431.1 hemolysin III family protein [Gammaproteobacteria bacterium]MDP2348770.1 hemolysin III family protein [Gammaproteobacteria bacterium]
MNATTARYRREQTRGEELANSISHGVGLVAALVASPFLLTRAAELDDAAFMVGVVIFAIAIVFQYLTSSLYHALPVGKLKQVLRVIEHSAIFVLIAGTYTPFTLGVLRGPWGWTLCAMVWTLALVGVVLKSSNRLFHPRLSNALFLLMGWLILVAIKPMLDNVPVAGLLWLLAGGIAYTVGVAFYAASSRVRYAHFTWHLFVMLGTACHYVAVYGYAA